jgi:hypothetical protein
MLKSMEHTKAVEMDGEWVVLDAENYLVTKLNETGGWIYNQLREGHRKEAVAEAMTAVYDITPEQANLDVNVFIEQLVRYGLFVHEG